MPTRPGINQSFDMTFFTGREQRIITRLSRDFYITRAADTTQVGNSKYRAFLMRPAEDMSVALNVEREIVLLFADYETFEARTLRAFDITYEQFDDVRVDRSLRFLVSADKRIAESIRHYLIQNPEYPIVIPFHYDEFVDYGNNLLVNSIRKNYLIRDLFGYQSPLKHEYFFFGRSKLVEGVLDLHKSGQNSGLFGLRKSGKTSTIYAIQRRAKTSGCRTLIIDCQDPAVHAKSFSSLLEYIVVETREELGLRKLDRSFRTSPDQASEDFRRAMTQTLGDARADILLIFDEIENISPKTAASAHWRAGNDTLLLWQTLRAFFQSTNKNKLTFCFVGTNPHLFELPKIQDIDNPVYLFAPKTFIPMLDLNEAREMIVRLGYFMGLDFDATVVSYIHNRFGGHPFFIRQICSQVHKNASVHRPQRVSLAACKVAEQDTGSDITGYFTDILHSLSTFYPEEFAMLEYLASSKKTTFKEMAQYAPAYIEHLVGYGIIVKRGDDYEFSFDAVSDAVKSTLAIAPIASLERKRQEISRRRNQLEEEVRSFLYRSTSRLSDDEWAAQLSRCLTKARQSHVGPATRREAFSRTKSPLYFLELLQFIKLSDDVRNMSEYQEDISAAMNNVNSARIDAHAKDITEMEYDQVLQSLETLERVFLLP